MTSPTHTPETVPETSASSINTPVNEDSSGDIKEIKIPKYVKKVILKRNGKKKNDH